MNPHSPSTTPSKKNKLINKSVDFPNSRITLPPTVHQWRMSRTQVATSDLRNQHRAKRGFQTGLTMINGAMETEAAPEPAGLPSGASQTLKVGGRQLSDQNNPSLPGGGAVAHRNPQPCTHHAGPRAARRHRRTREAQGSEITHSGSQIRSEAK